LHSQIPYGHLVAHASTSTTNVELLVADDCGGILSVVSEPPAVPINSESLARERCVELRAGTPSLTSEDARLLAGAIASEWHVDGTEIRREFTFKTFNAAFGLATRIALLAEAQNHHPELDVAWGRLVVRLTTHSVGGLSRNDFIMAARIDRLARG
jgi:4a-hydroxytetrahydrobiopterin dehydratase